MIMIGNIRSYIVIPLHGDIVMPLETRVFFLPFTLHAHVYKILTGGAWILYAGYVYISTKF